MRSLTLDKKRPQNPVKTGRAERIYSAQLSRVARTVGMMINGIPLHQDDAVPTIVRLMAGYADALIPWAEATARRMLLDVNAADAKAWKQMTAEMGAEIQREIASAGTGDEFRKLMAEQVELIRSIPLDAGKRVHDLVISGIENSTRPEQIAKEIMRSGEVSAGRARLIARTETSGAASAFQRARAEAIGSTQYVWKTSHDGDVRADHKKLDGQVFRWDDPPVADSRSGARAHPGCIYNCRCWAKPIIE